MNPRVATSLNKLRTACIVLLCTAMAWADFKTQNHSELCAKIISMFFKSLTSRTPEIVTVAKDGLRQVALVIETKDKEASLMYKQALELLSQALEVWPNANVKFSYLEKLLNSTPSSQSKDPSTALAQGLDVMNRVLEKQPHLFVRNNIEYTEPVPFRLIRNLQTFFSYFGVDGLIISAMCAAAQAVVSPKQSQHIWHHLAMFFRDELISWSWRRPLGMPPAPAVGGGGLNSVDLKQKIITNVEQAIGRINGIAPQYIIAEEEENGMGLPQSLQRGVIELVKAALTPRNLRMMDPTWHPWF